jgi:hypothetical protein
VAIIPCVACRKEVEETVPICPHCGTLEPKREMLVPCRVCGETVGKNARRCPHCKNPNPNKKKYLRVYLCWVFIIGWVFYLSNMRNLHSNRVWDTMTLGDIFQIMFGIIPIWLIYKDLKDSSGLTKIFSHYWQSARTTRVSPCLKCYTVIPEQAVTCPNCREPVPKDI